MSSSTSTLQHHGEAGRHAGADEETEQTAKILPGLSRQVPPAEIEGSSLLPWLAELNVVFTWLADLNVVLPHGSTTALLKDDEGDFAHEIERPGMSTIIVPHCEDGKGLNPSSEPQVATQISSEELGKSNIRDAPVLRDEIQKVAYTGSGGYRGAIVSTIHADYTSNDSESTTSLGKCKTALRQHEVTVAASETESSETEPDQQCHPGNPNWHPPPSAFEREVVAQLHASCGDASKWNTKKAVIENFKAIGMWDRWCAAQLNEGQLKHFIRRLKRKFRTQNTTLLENLHKNFNTITFETPPAPFATLMPVKVDNTARIATKLLQPLPPLPSPNQLFSAYKTNIDEKMPGSSQSFLEVLGRQKNSSPASEDRTPAYTESAHTIQERDRPGEKRKYCSLEDEFRYNIEEARKRCALLAPDARQRCALLVQSSLLTPLSINIDSELTLEALNSCGVRSHEAGTGYEHPQGWHLTRFARQLSG
jgi:hypothetical protein